MNFITNNSSGLTIESKIIEYKDYTTYKIDKLFDIIELQELQDSFSNAMQIASVITDTDGRPITRPSNFCRLCSDLIQNTEKGKSNCWLSNSLKQFDPSNPLVITPCEGAGLLEAGARIIIDGQHVGNWLIGQVKSEDFVPEYHLNYAKEIGVDPDEYQQALAELQTIPNKKFSQIVAMLQIFSKNLSEMAWKNLLLNQKSIEQEMLIQTIRKNEERLALVIDATEEGIWDWDVVNNEIFYSPQWKKQIGYEVHELENNFETWVDHLHPEEKEACLKAVQDYLAHPEGHFFIEFRFRHKDGTYRWIHNKASCLQNEKGEVIRMFGAHTDFTDFKNTHETLRYSEERNKLLAELTIEGIVIHKKGIAIDLNPSLAEMLGYQKEELIGVNMLELVFKDDKEIVSENIIKDYAHPYEIRMVKKDGTSIPVEIEARNFEYNGEKWRVSAVRNLTFRKENEQLLKQKTEEIEAQNEEYQQLNEELLQTNYELARAKESAEESDRLKTAFLQNMSHEIRTPMNAIMGFASLLPDCFEDNERLTKYSEIISTRSADLLNIINDILDISKIESGQLPVTIENCDLKELFDELELFFTEHKERLKKPTILFSMHSANLSDVHHIQTDRVKLKQIFINLITNAFKFTEEGSVAGGFKRVNGNELLFYVSDTGIGIPAEKQQDVFKRFYQLSQYQGLAKGGTGLGLPIVKGLVELLGGRIWLESIPAKGTNFYFTLPYLAAEEAPASTRKKKAKNIPTYDFSNKKILLVEDDPFNSEYIKEILLSTHAEILLTDSGKKSIEMTLKVHPDIVLMDIRLPDFNGLEATRQIKRLWPQACVIAQTAYALSNDRQKAIESGCNDFISKPIKRNDLLQMLQKHINK